MKTKAAILLASLAALAPAMADILYVNNDTAYPAEYRTFDAAFAAAAPGDTIMLAGSTTSYGDIAIVGKPIKLVGNKSLNSNAPGQPARADEETTKIGFLRVGVTGGGGEARLLANGTTIESINMLFVSAWSNECTFKGCDASSAFIYGSGNLFAGCRFTSSVSLDRHEDTTVSPVHVAPGTNNLLQNCILETLAANSYTSGEFVNCIIGGTHDSDRIYDVKAEASLTLRNCVIGDWNIGSSGDFRVREKFGKGSTRLHHCLIITNGAGNAIPSLSADLNNLVAETIAEVFSNNFFTILAGSAAVGTGENGSNLGIYDGPAPYQWGGSPALPLINKLNILEANPTTGLTFRVEAEARD